MSTLEEWMTIVAAELQIEPAALDRDAVLDLTRDVAHGVARPAAPLTAYLVGVAVGQGEPVTSVVERVRRLLPQAP